MRFLSVGAACLIGTAGAWAQGINVPILQAAVTAQSTAGIQVSLADLDGDGVLDLVTARGVNFPIVSSLGQGDGTFTAVSFFSAGGLWNLPPILRDVTGDGVPDFLGQVGFGGGSVQLRTGLGDGGFGPGIDLLTGFTTVMPSVADLDGDGDLDVLLAATGGPAGSHDAIHQLINDGTGQLSDSGPLVGLNEMPVFFEAADLNGDAVPDLVLFDTFPTNTLRVQYGAGGLSYAPPVVLQFYSLESFRASDVQLVDFESDGDLDISVFRRAESLLDRFTNPGDGSLFGYATSVVPAGADRALLVDLSSNGAMDLVLSARDEGLLYVTSNGLPSTLVTVDGLDSPALRVAGDLDGDGRQDLLLQSGLLPSTRFSTLINASYPPGSPFSNLGGGLAGGAVGTPILVASGQPLNGQQLSLGLSKMPAATPAFVVLGLGLVLAPFKGGLLQPQPDVVLGPLLADGSGELALVSTWPNTPGGFAFWVQAWLQDGSGPVGFTATPTTRIDVP